MGETERILLPVSLPESLELLFQEPDSGKMLAWFVCLKVTGNETKGSICIKDEMQGSYGLVRKTKQNVLKTQWFQWELKSRLKQE